MNQLLGLQKQNIEKHIAPSLAEQNALAQSESRFLSNQARYQELNEEIAKRTEERLGLESEKRGIDSQLATQKAKAAKKFEVLDRRHHLVVATFQLVFLIPILLIAAYLLLRWRATIYAPLIYALGLATLTKVVLVIHEHFPTRYFKYILLLAALALVLRVLIYLIRSSARLKEAELLKQYREAYERFLCPLCEYPIRRGPMKYAFWNRRSVRKLAPIASIPTADEPYVCPSCGSRLFEVCGRCKAIRHSLLPFCTQCGQEDREGVTPNPASAV
jgi:predicted RNA-binding Zn-ribbon protein involved in translation (DUF1610 family)